MAMGTDLSAACQDELLQNIEVKYTRARTPCAAAGTSAGGRVRRASATPAGTDGASSHLASLTPWRDQSWRSPNAVAATEPSDAAVQRVIDTERRNLHAKQRAGRPASRTPTRTARPASARRTGVQDGSRRTSAADADGERAADRRGDDKMRQVIEGEILSAGPGVGPNSVAMAWETNCGNRRFGVCHCQGTLSLTSLYYSDPVPRRDRSGRVTTAVTPQHLLLAPAARWRAGRHVRAPCSPYTLRRRALQ